MKRSVALAGLVGLTLFAAGMTVALTGAEDRTRLIASAVMVTGMITVVAAALAWANGPRTGAVRVPRSPTRRAAGAGLHLHHAPGVSAARRQISGR